MTVPVCALTHCNFNDDYATISSHPKAAPDRLFWTSSSLGFSCDLCGFQLTLLRVCSNTPTASQELGIIKELEVRRRFAGGHDRFSQSCCTSTSLGMMLLSKTHNHCDPSRPLSRRPAERFHARRPDAVTPTHPVSATTAAKAPFSSAIWPGPKSARIPSGVYGRAWFRARSRVGVRHFLFSFAVLDREWDCRGASHETSTYQLRPTMSNGSIGWTTMIQPYGPRSPLGQHDTSTARPSSPALARHPYLCQSG